MSEPIDSSNWPVYQCHKRVRALKVVSIQRLGMDHMSVFAEGRMFDFREPEVSRIKATSADLGYLVAYEDGYISWSPTKAFDEGYSLTASIDEVTL